MARHYTTEEYMTAVRLTIAKVEKAIAETDDGTEMAVAGAALDGLLVMERGDGVAIEELSQVSEDAAELGYGRIGSATGNMLAFEQGIICELADQVAAAMRGVSYVCRKCGADPTEASVFSTQEIPEKVTQFFSGEPPYPDNAYFWTDDSDPAEYAQTAFVRCGHCGEEADTIYELIVERPIEDPAG